MRISIILVIFSIILVCSLAIAVESSKPSTHDTSWMTLHGKVSRIDDSECMSCHVDRISCISCHEDQKPRNHTSGFVNKGHGLKAKWNRTTCMACHTDNAFCDECHSMTPPASHVTGWGGIYGSPAGGGTVRHCLNCHGAISTFGQTVGSRSCKTCHATLPNNGNHPLTP